MPNRIYVGCNAQDLDSMQVFRSAFVPTFETHGNIYAAVIGPFRTLAGAEFMAKYGKNNPHCRCVAEAEKLAKHYAKIEGKQSFRIFSDVPQWQ